MRTQRGGLRLGGHDRVVLIAFVTPAAIWLLAVQGYPLAYSLYLSFTHWSLAESDSPQGFASLGNYFQVLHDPQFLSSLRLSFLFVLSVPIELCVGFVLAICTTGEGKGMRGLRTVLLIPMVVAPIAVGAMWRLLLDSQSGLVDMLLRGLGLPAPDWLAGQSTSVMAVVGVDVWEWMAFSMIIYIAAMNGLDQGVLESARVDGATKWQTIRYLIVPMTKPATLLICVFRVIDAFLVIDIVYSLTYGGPGFSTNTATFWIYNQGLKYYNISTAAAASWILLVIALAMAVLILRAKDRAERRIGDST